MNISLIRFIIAAVLIMIGILIMVIQTFGVFKLNYALNRMHAEAIIFSNQSFFRHLTFILNLFIRADFKLGQ